jgi:hypothetical protein
VYPNVALQVIINPLVPIPSLHRAHLSDYLPFVAFEVDGESHNEPRQKEKDDFKNLLFEKAGIPLRRLPVKRQQSEEHRKNQLAEAIESLSGELERLLEAGNHLKNMRSILFGAHIRQYFDLLNRMFHGRGCAVLPNLALQSIFPSSQIGLLTPYDARNLCRKGLVDFCVFGVPDFRPLVAFSVNEDELQSRVFNHFGLPLLHLRMG